MRNKKVLVVVMALVACLAVGFVTEAAAKKKKIKVRTSVTLTVTTSHTGGPYGPSSAQGTFSGTVSARKKCQKGRRVTILKNGVAIGSTFSSGTGGYQAVFSGAGSGSYQAQVAKKKRKTKKAIIICKATISGPVTVP